MKKRAAPAKEQPLTTLILELKQLRTVVRETAENFVLSREGEIETMVEFLEGLPDCEARRLDTAPWLRELRYTPLKPEKGRIKDLKRLDGLLASLHDRIGACLDNQEAKGQKRRKKAKTVKAAKAAKAASPQPPTAKPSVTDQ